MAPHPSRIALEAEHLRAVVLADRPPLDQLRAQRRRALERYEQAKRAAVAGDA